MALVESVSRPGISQEVERSGAALITIRPLDYLSRDGQRAFGHYRLAARSGALTGAGIVAGAPLFSLQWREKDSVLVLFYLLAYLVPTTVFTAQQELGLDANLVSAFTLADSGGTAIPPEGVSRSKRAGMNPSLVRDLRIATTTLLTAGTRVLDANPFVSGSGLANVVNAAAGTAYVNPGGGDPPFGFRYEPIVIGEHPQVIGRDEGFLVRNAVAFPAAGVATLIVNAAWAEVPSY